MKKKSLLIGLGFDGDDGMSRVSRGDNLLIVGGSRETHERMQDCFIHVNEALEEMGKPLEECSPEEVIEIIREGADR